MAKRFRFDDEDDIHLNDENISQSDEIENMEKVEYVEPVVVESLNEEDDDNRFDDFDEESQPMSKKKKFVWKWWHYALIVCFVLCVALGGYLFVLSRHEGPVYGNRCEGMVVISKDIKDSAVAEIEKKYPEIKELSFQVACRQLKVYMTFEDGMNTKKAQQIAEEAVQTLDALAGYKKDEGKTYSQLFGTIDNVSQYEVNLILISQDSEDFPIYGTKHVQKDSFSYTLASIKDKDSYQKAKDTLEEE